MNKASLAIALLSNSKVEDAKKFIEDNLGPEKQYSFVVFDDESMLLFDQDNETTVEVILKPKPKPRHVRIT